MSPGYDIEGVKCIKESGSGKALLVKNSSCEEFEGEQPSGTCWVPKSQITDDSEVFEVGGEGTLCVTEWFAKKKGWLGK